MIRALLRDRDRLLQQAPGLFGIGLEESEQGKNRQGHSFDLTQAGRAGRACKRQTLLEVGAHCLGAADQSRNEALDEQRQTFFMLIAAGAGQGQGLGGQGGYLLGRARARQNDRE